MKVCIVCQKEIKGKGSPKVKEDNAIRFIRKIKQKVGVAKNNELYVCKEDIETHTKRRKDFEKNLIVSSVLAAGLVIFLIGLPLLMGTLDLGNLIGSIFIGALIILVVVFFRYTPAIEPAKESSQGGGSRGRSKG